jgi:UDP:flavonoid glycosyltransferase YjiC (YdhE family)
VDVLGDPRYRENAEHLRREIRALPEPEHAVELLEGLALERAPLANTSQQRAERRYERA